MALFALLAIASLGVAGPVAAQEGDTVSEQGTLMEEVIDESVLGVVREVAQGGTEGQQLDVEVLEGSARGRRITLEFHGPELAAGDQLFVRRLVTLDGEEHFQVEEIDRRGTLLAFAALFVLAVLALGRWQGVRALASLGLSIAAIVGILVPRILDGASPVLWGSLVAIGILLVSIALTHGINRASFAAFLGTAGAVGLTTFLATIAVAAAKFSGLANDASFYLDIETGGAIDLRGLLLAAIIIGTVGVLDDVAVTQAAAVEELHDASPTIASRELFRRAMRIGREHVGALVNTLALAYAGAALPLLLLFRGALDPLGTIVNREMFAAEIIRTVIGSIGVITAVPLATGFAVLFVHRKRTRS